MNQDNLTDEQRETFFGIGAAFIAGLVACVHTKRKADGKEVALLCVAIDEGHDAVRMYPVALLLGPDSRDEYEEPVMSQDMPLRP